MALEKYEGESMDLGFPKPADGTYVWVFEEGVDLYVNEDSGKESIKLPQSVFMVARDDKGKWLGDEDALDNKNTMFIGIGNKTAEKQLNAILTFTGLIDTFIEKLGTDIDIKDPKFIAGLKKLLPGKMIQCTHKIKKTVSKKDGLTYENINFTNMAAYNEKKQKVAPAQAQAASNATPAADEGGWD